MSASSPSLKNPAVIGVLVVAAVAVTILNLQTFGPRARSGPRVQATMQNQPALPPDLALLVQRAMTGSTSAGDGGSVPGRELPRLPRDPFHAVTPGTEQAAPPPRVQTAPRQDLVCSAVMTGGKRPSALLNGKFYSPGDKVQGYTLAWIATNGVTLETSGGAKKFIPLANRSRKSGAVTVKLGQRTPTSE
jgi:hypothetical protein